MSYLLGFVVVDGCISKCKDRKSNPFTFNITSKDKGHLIKLQKILGSNHKLSIKNKNRPNLVYQIQIRNSVLANDLISLGIMPQKTKNLNFIEVPDKYFKDFVRGFFDGDGTVYIYRVNNVPQIRVKFLSTSLNFMSAFNSSLCNKPNIPIKTTYKLIGKTAESKIGMTKFEMYFYIDDCYKLARFMYSGDPVLCLERKRQIFEQFNMIKRRKYIKKNYPSKIGQLNSLAKN